MSSLAIFTYGEIRVTHDFRYSVYDIIEVIGGKKNPRDSWKALSEPFPEVVAKTDNFQFAGVGQRPTPVTSKEGVLYIIGLLPGTVGKSYREDAANLMLAKIEGLKAQSQITLDSEFTPERALAFCQAALSVTRLSSELQLIYSLRAIEAQFPQISPMLTGVVAAIQETTATADRHLSPSELGEVYADKYCLDKPIRPADINIALESVGLQWKEVIIKTDKHTGKDRKINVWQLTDAGKKWGVVVQDKARGHDKTVEHVRWLPTVLDVIELGRGE